MNSFIPLTVSEKERISDKGKQGEYDLYDKGVWKEARKRIRIRHKISAARLDDKLMDQMMEHSKTATLQKKDIIQASPLKNELLQQVIVIILSTIFDGKLDSKAWQKPDDQMRAISQIKGPLHRLVTGRIHIHVHVFIDLFLREKIADKHLFHLIKSVMDALEQEARKQFLTKDLVRFFRELACQRFDRWIRKQEKVISYHRVEDQFFIAFKQDATALKALMQQAKELAEKEGMQLQKIELSLAKKGVHFLGYKIKQVPASNDVLCQIPEDAIRQFIKKHHYGDWQNFNALSRTYLLHRTEASIVQTYNRELYAFARRYKFATNFHRLRPLLFLARKSLCQTIARKRNRTVKQIKKEFVARQQAKEVTFITYPQLKKLSKTIN